ncbi:SixA phosphatase family protein [Microbulbifer taiwanensis]|uniref:SixA phosphatase family protein n=1 Tax=Microbulbifer taiwanensis TaxID=986746 RepID=UPI003615A9AF
MLRIVTIVFAFLVGAPWVIAQAGIEEKPQQVIYLVRHAEKVSGTDDRNPPLTESGRARAQHLAYVLGEAGIEKIYSSDYARTRQTAEPLADKLNLQVESYDPRALGELAQQLRQISGRTLVVGHSNTTPQLVELLGGESGAPIEEKVNTIDCI